MPGPRSVSAATAGQRRQRQHDGRRAVGILVGAQRETVERRQSRRHRRPARNARLRRIVGQRRAGVEAQPGDDRVVARRAPGRARPACRGRTASAPPRQLRRQRRRRRGDRRERLRRARDWPAHPSRRGTPLRVEHRVGEAAVESERVHQSSPRTMVKKSTLVAAVSSRRCLSAA